MPRLPVFWAPLLPGCPPLCVPCSASPLSASFLRSISLLCPPRSRQRPPPTHVTNSASGVRGSIEVQKVGSTAPPRPVSVKDRGAARLQLPCSHQSHTKAGASRADLPCSWCNRGHLAGQLSTCKRLHAMRTRRPPLQPRSPAALALLAALLCGAAPPAAAGGRALLQLDDLGLPSRLSSLCSGSVSDGQFLPVDSFSAQVGHKAACLNG